MNCHSRNLTDLSLPSSQVHEVECLYVTLFLSLFVSDKLGSATIYKIHEPRPRDPGSALVHDSFALNVQYRFLFAAANNRK